MYAGDDKVFAALEAGASGFVGKDAPVEEVIAAARHAAATPSAFTARDLAGVMRRRATAPVGPQLSPREREVLGLLVDGLAIAQIARRLYISESTAKTHVAKIYEKLGAGNRAQAVMAAVRLGLVPVSYTHLRAHETVLDLVCRLLLEKKKKEKNTILQYNKFRHSKENLAINT